MGSEEIDCWYFPQITRSGAENMLLAEGNAPGTFLIRNRESRPGALALSVLDIGRVIHYKLRETESGAYYVSETTAQFDTLKQMVQYYSTKTLGTRTLLGKPCKKMEVQWEIDRRSIELLRKLGEGHFGEVFEGLLNGTNLVAVKTLKQGTMDKENFIREAEIMKRLRHKNLVQLDAVCTMREPFYIITELMKNGSLLEYLQKDNGSTLRISDQIEMASQVAAGMAFLELQNYIHRDLAARNVLVGENNICKVADFGLARVIMKGDVYNTRAGTPFPVRWTAPEAFDTNKYTIKSDVWSFGILLYEIMTFGQMPYPGMTSNKVMNKVFSGYRMPCPPHCPKVMYDSMMECWNQNEQERPQFQTLQLRLKGFLHLDLTS